MPRFHQNDISEIPIKKRVVKLLKDMAEIQKPPLEVEGTPFDIVGKYEKMIEFFYTYLVYLGELSLVKNKYVGGENIVARILISGKKIVQAMKTLDFSLISKSQVEQIGEYIREMNELVEDINRDIPALGDQPEDRAVFDKINGDRTEINEIYKQQLRNTGILEQLRLQTLPIQGLSGAGFSGGYVPIRFY